VATNPQPLLKLRFPARASLTVQKYKGSLPRSEVGRDYLVAQFSYYFERRHFDRARYRRHALLNAHQSFLNQLDLSKKDESVHCLIVSASPREIDRLRAEASRIARQDNADWWVEKQDKGMHFCFGSSEARAAFAQLCTAQNVHCSDA
jgi:hypothetical protein